jgi:DNA-binding GntR family transcriptional regulator
VLDPRSDRALYRQLADILRGKIVSGELQPGSKLPSEMTLAQEYDLARPAVRNAIQLLRIEGLIVTERGYGTRVREAPEREQVRLELGQEAVCRMPTEAERLDLGLDQGVPVVDIDGRLYAADKIKLTA